MMQKGYEWLWSESGPKMLTEALALYGTQEVPGPKSNPVILGWAHEVNTTYPGDDVAWCGLFISVCAKRAGWDYHPNGNALWARNWASWEAPATGGVAMLGDVLVFSRGSYGHVGMYVGEDDACYHVLGGNQSDGVNITRVDKKRCIAVRRAHWKIAQPFNVRKIILSSKGAPVGGSEE